MPDLFYMVAVAGLSLSGLAAAIRLIEWLIRTDPKLIAQTGRWAAAGLAILAAPLLLALLIKEKWAAAMALAAMMLIAFAWYGPRLLQRLARSRFTPDWRKPPHGDVVPAFDAAGDDPETVRRSIAILEEYLSRQTALAGRDDDRSRAAAPRNGGALNRADSSLSAAEALEILGLGADASDIDIEEAHRRLRGLMAPEHGGSHYLAAKIDQARSTLFGRIRGTAGHAPPVPGSGQQRGRPQ